MEDRDKTKKELTCELEVLRRRIADLERNRTGDAQGTDTSAREQSPKVIKESEDHYRSLFEESPISLWEEDFSDVRAYIDRLPEQDVKDLRAYFDSHPEEVQTCAAKVKIIDVNKRTLELYQAADKKVLIENLNNVFAEASHSIFKEELIALLNREESVPTEAVTQTLKGEKRYVGVKWVVAPGFEQTLSKVIVSIIDLTERKRMEEELRENRRHLQTIIDTEPECVKLLDEKGTLLDMNPAGLAMIEADSIEQVRGEAVYSMIQEAHLPAFMNLTRRVFKGESGILEFELIGLKGTHRWLETHATPLRNEKGVITALLSITRDITERKQTEEALRESEERFKTLVSNIPGATYRCACDPERTVEFMSDEIEKLCGYPASDFFGNQVRSYAGLIHPEDRQKIEKIVLDKVARKEPYTLEYRIIHADRSIHWVYEKGQGVFNKEGELLWLDGAIFDITERMKMEKEFQKVEKLESLGLLAGGIAHDFNNILTAILGNISLSKFFSEADENIKEILTEAEDASLRARDLTQQLLTFSKGGAPIKKAASIKDIITESASFALRGSNVKCEYRIEDDLHSVEVDPGQISQVFHNLIINAFQAMPKGGTIKIHAENCPAGSTEGLPLKEKDYIKVTLQDQGTGIPEDHLQKIFDPYFTTKQKGSGLGLATTYSIIAKHEGHIAVESELGAGTRFTIYLPASGKTLHVDKGDAEICPSGSGRILVMDDEAAVRKVIEQMLRQVGYEVACSKEGAETVEMYRHALNAGKPYRAVIMDLTIPGGMGGKETIGKLLEIDPDVTAIVSSGYSNDPIMADYKKYGFRGMIAKPYKSEEISRVLYNILGAGHG